MSPSNLSMDSTWLVALTILGLGHVTEDALESYESQLLVGDEGGEIE